VSADEANFEGHAQSECGEHRTVGPHRAWCFACSEWCYPSSPCKGCELPQVRSVVDTLRATLQATRDELNRWGHGDFHYGAQKQERSVVEAVERADRVLKDTLDA
jgi:hypothetical protein